MADWDTDRDAAAMAMQLAWLAGVGLSSALAAARRSSRPQQAWPCRLPAEPVAACIMPAQSSRPDQGPMSDQVASLRQPAATNADALIAEVAGLIVRALNLEVAPAEIAPDKPLYGEGLGLDSIDILEIALVVSKQYGVQLRADSEENGRIFGSLRQLVDYITAHRTK
jgi:acyl carrier protein